ncbi:MAG: RDD family protein, partial [Thermoleophilia bacterium]
MQQARPHEQVQYASLSWRFAAVIVDSGVLFLLLVAAFVVLVAFGVLDLNDPLLNRGFSLERAVPSWMYVLSYGLVFVYYTLLETLTGSSLGKLAFGMRVTMDDGSRPHGLAVVARNLVRIPEVIFWYVPAGISCLLSDKNKRLGDVVAHTVVVRRGAAAATPLRP